MLFDLYYKNVIPHHSYDKNNKYKDYSGVFPTLAAHSEVARPEYNYIWNSDGLRSIEFSNKPNVIALGCSITLGQGLPVDLRWSNLLSDMLNKHGEYSIGNISYSGAAINKDVSSFFGLINQYNYLPEYVICNFANFERFYFVDSNNEYMRDNYANHKPRAYKANAPFDYESIIPYEWIYYNNLEHIKMLEVFCKANNIKLIWSCWSNNLDENKEKFLLENFEFYVQDPTRKQFPKDFEFFVNPDSTDNLKKYYKMNDWDLIRCHEDYYSKHKEIFDHGYDYHKIAGSWGPGAHWPHPGVHKQIHWAEFYYEEMKKKNWI